MKHHDLTAVVRNSSVANPSTWIARSGSQAKENKKEARWMLTGGLCGTNSLDSL
ncbi:MAG: hypothetical protein M1312_02765 [Patescibacteria group bacterium]|nr:hypothetical protein [Patescibacteria group bacterium]